MFRTIARRVISPRINPRAYSTAITSDLKARGPWYYVNEPISTSQIEKIDASFSGYVPSHSGPRVPGQPLPSGFHLLFFNNVSPESNLSSDGYHKSQAPDETKFPARMWLGGTLEFNPQSQYQLEVGGAGSAKEEISAASHQQREVNDVTIDRVDVTLNRYLYGGDSVSKAVMDESNQWAIKETRGLAYFSPEAGKNREATFTRHIRRKLHRFISTCNPINLLTS